MTALLLVSSLALIAAFVTSACGADRSNPTGPNPAPTATEISQTARTYLDTLLGTMKTYSINTAAIDWAGFRTEVFGAAGTAQTVADTYPAIGVALRLLNDSQSYYNGRSGLIGPSPVGGCSASVPGTLALPDTVGYVKVESCDCAGAAANQFAEAIQKRIEIADRPGLLGWIVDLRGNFGGNMWPMIAGVGPVLGEGIVGFIVYNDREYEREYRDGAATSLGETFARVDAPYRLLREHPKVAVLTDKGTASAGEAIVVFFRGRPDTRSFGSPTCGHHHLQQDFPLSDGAVLGLVVSQHADRTKTQYGGPIDPDEIVDDSGEEVSRAVSWLQSRN